jgi:hypothetical protein
MYYVFYFSKKIIFAIVLPFLKHHSFAIIDELSNASVAILDFGICLYLYL